MAKYITLAEKGIKRGASVMGEGNPVWKGDNVKKHSLHTWINDNFERPKQCEICGADVVIGKQYDWSNKDHKYTRLREDWQYVCRKCHYHYDIKHNNKKMPWSAKAAGRWSKHFDKCVECGTTETPHGARGKCKKCHKREYYQSHKNVQSKNNSEQVQG
jgi:hypothetical protein